MEALIYNPTTYAMEGVHDGYFETGAMTVLRTTTQYVLDKDGVYQAISANNPAWYGARYSGGVAYADDGTGTLLDPLPMLQIDPALTNSLTYSSDLTNAAWTASNMTTAYTSTGLTGAANSATRITATDANATIIRASAETAASATHTVKWFIKRITGTGTIELTIDNGSTWTDITTSVGSSFGEGIEVEQAALTNPQVGIRIVTSGDAVDIGNAELFLNKGEENVSLAGPIFTTSTAVTTRAQTTSFNVANHSDVSGAYYLEIEFGFNKGEVTNEKIINTNFLYLTTTTGHVRSYDGSSTAEHTGEYSKSTVYTIGIIYNTKSNKKAIKFDSTWGNTTTYDGSFTNILTNSNATGVVKFRNLRIYRGGSYSQLKSIIDRLTP